MKEELVVACALLLLGCGASDYEATTTVGSMSVIARLQHDHPYLAEYKKYVEVRGSGVLPTRKELFKDSGGYTWIALYRVNNDLIIQDFGPDSVIVDLSTGNSRMVNDLGNQVDGYLGRFDFDKSQKRRFRFISANEETFVPSKRIKGG